MNFKKFDSKNGIYHIPEDIDLTLPEESTLEDSQLHYLAYIRWRDKLLDRVPSEYRDFFEFVHPYLKCRTTDVHTAGCIPFIEQLVSSLRAEVNSRIVYIAFILHDIGWGYLGEAEIAHSLAIAGLKLNGDSMKPKEKHAIVGSMQAQKILEEYKFNPELTNNEREIICKAVLFHDKPEELSDNGKIPVEMKVVCDADHLWSYTKENFWQDTVRKGVSPEVYLKNLGNDLKTHFATDLARNMARRMLKERSSEVAQLNQKQFNYE